jgi:hypothetical protein
VRTLWGPEVVRRLQAVDIAVAGCELSGREHRTEVLDLLLQGRVPTRICSAHELKDVCEALREVAERRAVGRFRRRPREV